MQLTNKALMDFLSDKTQHELRYESYGTKFSLLKVAYDEDTDFLYLVKTPDDTAYCNMRYCSVRYSGVYSRVQNQIYDVDHNLMDVYSPCSSVSGFLSQFSEKVNKRVKEIAQGKYVGNGELPPFYPSDEENTLYEAKRIFCGGSASQPLYSEYLITDGGTSDVAYILNHYDEAVEKYAQQYILTNEKKINGKIRKINMVKEALANLETTPGPHHAWQKILQSIDKENMKTITMEFEFCGQPARVKVFTSVMRPEFSDYLFCKMLPADFPIRSDDAVLLNADSVLKITYGKRVLYKKGN